MKYLKEANIKKGMRVLLRCNFNCPLDENGEVLNDYGIRATIPTIRYLIEKGSKVILMSHLGRPRGKVVENLRLVSVRDRLMKYLNCAVYGALDCIGSNVEKIVKQMKPGEIILLENLRFHKEETEYCLSSSSQSALCKSRKASEVFAKKLAGIGDIFVNDAFGACHRCHASIVGVPRRLPSFAGFLLEKEIKELSSVLENFKRPLVVVMGGIKVSTKIKFIEKFLEFADHIMLGGALANTVLAAKGIAVGKSIIEGDWVSKIKEEWNLCNPKLHLPIDVKTEKKLQNMDRRKIIARAVGKVTSDETIFDIGDETISLFKNIISEAKTIIWNGPLGYFEKEEFRKGTREIMKVMSNNKGFKMAGGGETLFIISKYGFEKKFDFISTGGGAMLEFLADGKIPGIEILEKVK